MSRFEVDVSAFFAFQVDAASADEAAAIAREFVREAMTATPHTIDGYNSTAGTQIVPAEIVPGVESTDVEEFEL